VVEVADTTLVTDRFKAQLYAQAGVPVYWLVNLPEQVIEVMQAPQSGEGLARYSQSTQYFLGDHLPVVIAGQIVAHLLVDDLLA
jgi:Uma2 family endonuclease